MPQAFDFDKTLKLFVSSTKRSMLYARQLAEYSFDQFEQGGNLAPAQTFFDEMGKTGKNYVRRMAFIKWMADNSPLKIEKGKLTKDKSEDATPFNRKAAMATPFWEANPDPEQVPFSALIVTKRLKGVIKSLEGERYKAEDEKAKKALKLAHKMVDDFEKAAAAIV